MAANREREPWSWSNDAPDPDLRKGTAAVGTRSNLRNRLRVLAPDLVAYVGALVFVAACAYGIAGLLMEDKPVIELWWEHH